MGVRLVRHLFQPVVRLTVTPMHRPYVSLRARTLNKCPTKLASAQDAARRDPPLHELTDGIFACETCIDATLAVLPKIPTATDNEGSDLDCNSVLA